MVLDQLKAANRPRLSCCQWCQCVSASVRQCVSASVRRALAHDQVLEAVVKTRAGVAPAGNRRFRLAPGGTVTLRLKHV